MNKLLAKLTGALRNFNDQPSEIIYAKMLRTLKKIILFNTTHAFHEVTFRISLAPQV